MLETMFTLANGLALTGWIALAVFPSRRWAVEGVAGLAVPLLLAIAYCALIGVAFSGAEGGYGSLAQVALLFQTSELLLAGWLHYLAFDLLIGVWIVRTARSEGIAHLLVLPCLFLTFLFGPMGFFAFIVFRLLRASPQPQEI